jgi:hypothetical protein
MDGIFLGHNLLLSQAFRWESLDGWDFSRPQLVVVSGLFFFDGILAIAKPFSHTFFFFHDGISAITEPLSRTLSFFTMELRLSRSLSHELFFFTMELRLSQSLSHELFLFSQWNFGYHRVFLTNSFFFHDGTSAITESFSRTLSFFTMELRLLWSLSHELFLFSRWNFGYHGAFLTNSFFSRWNFETQNTKRAIWGKTLFIYISERVFT